MKNSPLLFSELLDILLEADAMVVPSPLGYVAVIPSVVASVLFYKKQITNHIL
jgi:hypothetical protein